MLSEERSVFRIHGVPVALRCEHEGALKRINDHLKVYRVSGPEVPSPSLEVDIRYGSRIYPVPLHAKRVLLYESIRCYYLGGIMYFTDFFSTLTVERGGARVYGNLSPDTIKDFGLNPFVDLLLTLTLFEALRFHGLYYLHASALEGTDGTSYVISGNAGSGKTTLTISLILAGWKYLSDDTVFMRLCGDRDVEVLGFARDFHLPSDLIRDTELLKRFKDLPDYCPRRGRKLLAPEQWFPGQRLDGFLNPRVLLFPGIRGQDSGVRPLSMAESLKELLPQSLAVMFNPETAPSHLEALKRMVGRGRAFRLVAGPEVKGDPAAAVKLVETARDMAKDRAGTRP